MISVLSKRHLYALVVLCVMLMISFSFLFLMRYTPLSDPSLMTVRIVDGLMILSRKSGISLERLVLKGNRYLSDNYLLSLAQLYPQKPLLQSSPMQIGESLMASGGWVSGFVVERRFPDGMLIEIKENTPDVFWQTKDRFLSAEGKEMVSHSRDVYSEVIRDRLSRLPLVVGAGSGLPSSWKNLRTLLGKFPTILKRISTFRWVRQRRWNLILKSGELIKLPEEGLFESLLLLSKLQERHQLLERNLFGIDLRFHSRMIIERRERSGLERGTTVMLENGKV